MNERVHFHWNRLIENINPARPVVQQFLDTQANRLNGLSPAIRAGSQSKCWATWYSAKR